MDPTKTGCMLRLIYPFLVIFLATKLEKRESIHQIRKLSDSVIKKS